MATTIDYTWLGKIENEIRQSSYPLKEITYADSVTVHVFVESDQIDAYKDWITELTNGQAKTIQGKSVYLETDA